MLQETGPSIRYTLSCSENHGKGPYLLTRLDRFEQS